MKNKSLLIIGILLFVTLACSLFYPSSPKLPNYGVFLVNGQSYVELKQYSGQPDLNSIISELEITSSTPSFLVWYPQINLQYFLLVDPRYPGSGIQYKVTPQDNKNQILEISPSRPLDEGIYCLYQGDPLGNPYTLPFWCFRVKNGSANSIPQDTNPPSSIGNNQTPTNTSDVGAYAWRAFPVKVEETPGKDQYYQDGWKYLIVDFGIERLGTSKGGDERNQDFEDAILAMSLVNDAGFTYQPEVLKISGGIYTGYWHVNPYSYNGDVESYVCSFCWWPDVGFTYHAWIGPNLNTVTVNTNFVASPLDFAQSPMHTVFHVPENSESYTLTIPDGTAVQPGEFHLNKGINLPQENYPFKDMASHNILSAQDDIKFQMGTLRILNITATKNELDIKYSFHNSSKGYEASGGARSFLIDDKGFAYDTLDLGVGDIDFRWEAGPGVTVNGIARFPLPSSSNHLWLVLAESYKGTDGLYYNGNLEIVALPMSAGANMPSNENNASSTNAPLSTPSDVSITISTTSKGDFLQINADSNPYKIGPVEKGAYALGPNSKFFVYCTNSGIVYAAHIGDTNLTKIGSVKDLSAIIQGEAPQVDFQFFGDNPYTVQIHDSLFNQNETLSIPSYITK